MVFQSIYALLFNFKTYASVNSTFILIGFLHNDFVEEFHVVGLDACQCFVNLERYEAFSSIFANTPLDDVDEPVREAALEWGEVEFVFDDVDHSLLVVVVVPGGVADDDLLTYQPERPHVHLLILALDQLDFGCDVVYAPAGLRAVSSQVQGGQPKIDDLQHFFAVFGRDENVFWFQVAVYDICSL